jgi:hypothetical protein
MPIQYYCCTFPNSSWPFHQESGRVRSLFPYPVTSPAVFHDQHRHRVSDRLPSAHYYTFCGDCRPYPNLSDISWRNTVGEPHFGQSNRKPRSIVTRMLWKTSSTDTDADKSSCHLEIYTGKRATASDQYAEVVPLQTSAMSNSACVTPILRICCEHTINAGLTDKCFQMGHLCDQQYWKKVASDCEYRSGRNNGESDTQAILHG